MYKYAIFKIKYGCMGAVKSDKGLHMIILPLKTEKEVKQKLEEHYSVELERDEKGLEGIRRELRDYFEGKKVKFKEGIDAGGATSFELKVWDIAEGIPYGEVRSYDWIAKKIGGKSSRRAVGQALSRNRLPIIIPCHRVTAKSGDIGGFSYGAEMKRLLLKIEGRVL